MKGKELLLIAISSFVLTVIWIASNVYHSYATSTLDSLLQVQIMPIAPSFDMATVEKLKQRTKIAPATTSLLTTPTPSLSPSPVEEQELEITLTPEPTLIELPIDSSESGSLTP